MGNGLPHHLNLPAMAGFQMTEKRSGIGRPSCILALIYDTRSVSNVRIDIYVIALFKEERNIV